MAGADRMTQAVTLFALLELYKGGELTWKQSEPFGPIQIQAAEAAQVNPLARQVVAMLFNSSQPVAEAELREALGCGETELDRSPRAGGAGARRGPARDRAAARGGRLCARLGPRDGAGGAAAACKAANPAALAGAGRVPGHRGLPAPRVSRPEIARIRGVNSESPMATLEERGLIEECGRSRFGAIQYRTTPLFQKLFGLESLDSLPDLSEFEPDAEEQQELREKLLRAGEQRVAH